MTSITRLLNTLALYYIACIQPVPTNHSNIDLIHCDQREHELYQLWNEVPSQDTILSQDNSCFWFTRSVRLYHTCCTKYISVAQQSDNLLHSLRTEFAESCATGPRAKLFSDLWGANELKNAILLLFSTIFSYFWLFPRIYTIKLLILTLGDRREP